MDDSYFHCAMYDWCRNHHLCEDCSDHPENASETDLALRYKPASPFAPLHPRQTTERNLEASAQQEMAFVKKAEDRRRRQVLGKKARRNEAETGRAIVRATVASGAVCGDGDARIGSGYFGIDYKLQTKSTSQFTVKVAEVDKAWYQHRNIIVITTAHGDRFAVARLDNLIAFATELGDLRTELGENK